MATIDTTTPQWVPRVPSGQRGESIARIKARKVADVIRSQSLGVGRTKASLRQEACLPPMQASKGAVARKTPRNASKYVAASNDSPNSVGCSKPSRNPDVTENHGRNDFSQPASRRRDASLPPMRASKGVVAQKTSGSVSKDVVASNPYGIENHQRNDSSQPGSLRQDAGLSPMRACKGAVAVKTFGNLSKDAVRSKPDATENRERNDSSHSMSVTKSKACGAEDFKTLDAYGRDAPESHARSFQELATYLTKPAQTELGRARVLFSWVAHHVAYDVAGLRGHAKMKSCKPEDVLVHRTSVCAGYAAVFEKLAKVAGLNVCTISGHARNSSRDIGQDLRAQNVGRHAWSAVKVEGRWLLIDCTWGAGTTSETKFTASYNPYYFDVPPVELAHTHHPEEQDWQLLAKPMSYQDFISGPIVNSAFFECALAFPQQQRAGRIVLKDKNTHEIRLRAMAGVQATASCGDNDRCAMVQHDGNDLVISVECPGFGDHHLSIFTRGPDSAGESYTLAVKYCITVCQGATMSHEGFPTLYGLFGSLGAVLDAPRVGCLKKGVQHFRIRFDRKTHRMPKHLVVHSGSSRTMLRPSAAGVFEGAAEVSGDDATVFCAFNGETTMQGLFQCTVGA